MNQKDCAEVKKEIQSRLNKIKGQVNGVDKMVADGRDCSEIVQQITAIRSALSNLAIELLKDDGRVCFSGDVPESEKLKRFENLVQTFFKIS
jgi:DNA-binding FrmR family transcriptional regulator